MVNNLYKSLRNYGIPTDKKVYVIAEIGINHGGDLNRAKDLIYSAASTGVDAVKFQIYKADDRAPKNNFEIYQLLKNAEMSYEDFSELKAYDDQCNVDFIATAFDFESVDFLNKIHSPVIKISSFDLENSKLINYINASPSKVICSVGISQIEAIDKIYSQLNNGNRLSIMHCVSLYPLMDEDANLGAIFSLKSTYNCPIGYSDHTIDIHVPLYAVAAGAQIIEKHYKISESMRCIDSSVSITEVQMKEMVKKISQLEKIMGSGAVKLNDKTAPNLIFKRKN